MSEVGYTTYRGSRLAFEIHGEGPRVFVFTHGLLLDAALNRRVATLLGRQGYRVILPELLGHGRSDHPTHAYEHRLDYYAEQVVAILDHLGIDDAVIGGVSLGANVALQVASTDPERVRGMVLEMPVLERGALAALAQFYPLLMLCRYGGTWLRPMTRVVRALPRTGIHALDSFLGFAGTDPREIAAVLHGLFVGPGSPAARVRRELDIPTLVIGHRGDLVHPMDDADALARELPDAHLVQAWSALELRTAPRRLVAEIDAFLTDAWLPRMVRPDADAGETGETGKAGA